MIRHAYIIMKSQQRNSVIYFFKLVFQTVFVKNKDCIEQAFIMKRHGKNFFMQPLLLVIRYDMTA